MVTTEERVIIGLSQGRTCTTVPWRLNFFMVANQLLGLPLCNLLYITHGWQLGFRSGSLIFEKYAQPWLTHIILLKLSVAQDSQGIHHHSKHTTMQTTTHVLPYVISEAFISSVFRDTFKSSFVYDEKITDISLLELNFISDVGICYKDSKKLTNQM